MNSTELLVVSWWVVCLVIGIATGTRCTRRRWYFALVGFVIAFGGWLVALGFSNTHPLSYSDWSARAYVAVMGIIAGVWATLGVVLGYLALVCRRLLARRSQA